MSYSRSGTLLSASFDRIIQGAIEDISTGEIDVPLAPIGQLLDIGGTYESVEVIVSYDGNGCFYEGPAFIPIGTMLEVDFVNHSASASVAAIGRTRPVEVAARAGGQGHGQVAMLEDLPVRCEPIIAIGNDEPAEAAMSPQWEVEPDEVDVAVTTTLDSCEVRSAGELFAGQLVVFQTSSESPANGGSCSWAVPVGFDPQDFSPTFAADGYWRWQDVAARDTVAYARRLAAGQWAVGVEKARSASTSLEMSWR